LAVQTVWRTLVKHQLNRLSRPSLKPIERFEAPPPNDLWQIELQGRVKCPHLGWLYLILVLDDHSRYLLSGGWFRSQHTGNVFACVGGYPGPSCRWPAQGHPERSGEPVPPHRPTGRQADFEDAMARLGIRLIVARRARTKGKIERRFGFVQRDVMLEHLQERLNATWHAALRWSTASTRRPWADTRRVSSTGPRPGGGRRWNFKSCSLMKNPAAFGSMGRSATMAATTDRVPAGSLTCRVWTTLRGETLRIEALGRTIATHRLVP
jgi:hypothetical protein